MKTIKDFISIIMLVLFITVIVFLVFNFVKKVQKNSFQGKIKEYSKNCINNPCALEISNFTNFEWNKLVIVKMGIYFEGQQTPTLFIDGVPIKVSDQVKDYSLGSSYLIFLKDNIPVKTYEFPMEGFSDNKDLFIVDDQRKDSSNLVINFTNETIKNKITIQRKIRESSDRYILNISE
jgi:hypothetical protein